MPKASATERRPAAGAAPVRARFVQPDGRAIAKRQWKIHKDGPSVFLGSQCVKRLIQFGFAASFEAETAEPHLARVRFRNAGGNTFLFLRKLRLVAEVVARRYRVRVVVRRNRVEVLGPVQLWLRFSGRGRAVWVVWRPDYRPPETAPNWAELRPLADLPAGEAPF